MMTSCDFAIVGGGVIGLAIADAILAVAPDAKVVVLDKETELAAHASGRNSGVIHSGTEILIQFSEFFQVSS